MTESAAFTARRCGLPDWVSRAFDEKDARIAELERERDALRSLADGMRGAWSVAFDHHCPETRAYDEARRRWAGEKRA